MKENSIEEDIILLKDFIEGNFKRDKLENYKGSCKMGFFYYKDIQQAIEHILKELKRFENMYEAEHQIHLVRNEQLDRKQKAIIKCNELENENKELKKENEKLKHKIEGQECVIEKQAHNEEVYEKLVIKLEKENTELKEYISIAPNLDEMTAVKYRNIQQDAYIKGRAEEQQRAEQIIYENYIPVQKVKDILNEINKEYIKQEEIFNKYFEKENRDMEAYYIQKEATGIMQELSWVEGKLQELLEGRKI